jgi:hypothetical protein
MSHAAEGLAFWLGLASSPSISFSVGFSSPVSSRFPIAAAMDHDPVDVPVDVALR